jgi:Spy/CpxP family protein refolding chaperone
MNQRALIHLSLAAAIGAAGAGLAWADAQGANPRGRGGAARGERMAEYLGLNEEQRATWKSLHEQHDTEMQPLRQEGRDLYQKLRAATEAPNPDPAAVGAATLALKEHRDKVRAAQKAFEGQLTGMLTPEQKTKFEAFRAAHRDGRGWHGGYKGRRPTGEGPDNSPDGPVR